MGHGRQNRTIAHWTGRYIDGDHSYEAVTRDIATYRAKVKPNGVLAGDDYGLQGGWWNDGVTRAVDEFIRQTDVEILELGNDWQWAVQLPNQ